MRRPAAPGSQDTDTRHSRWPDSHTPASSGLPRPRLGSGVGRECQYLVDQYAGFVFSLAERKNETKKKEKNRCDQPHVVSDIPIAAAEILLLLFEHAAQSRSCERAAADH